MTRKDYLLIQVTAWAGLTVVAINCDVVLFKIFVNTKTISAKFGSIRNIKQETSE